MSKRAAPGPGAPPAPALAPDASLPGGLPLALGAAALYGANIVGARIAAEAGISGVALVLYRAAPMLALALGAAALAHAPLAPPRGERGGLLALGLATAVVGPAYFSAVAFVPVSVAVAVFYAYPALIVLADPLVGSRRPPRPRQFAVVIAALAGIGLVVGPAAVATSGSSLDPRGLALALVAAVATAAQFFAARRCRDVPLAAKAACVHLAVLPAVALMGLVAGVLNPPGDLLRAPGAVAGTVVSYLAGFLFQVMALARAPAPLVGIAFCLEPVVAAGTAVLVLGETLDPLQLAGIGLVLASIAADALLGPDPSTGDAS